MTGQQVPTLTLPIQQGLRAAAAIYLNRLIIMIGLVFGCVVFFVLLAWLPQSYLSTSPFTSFASILRLCLAVLGVGVAAVGYARAAPSKGKVTWVETVAAVLAGAATSKLVARGHITILVSVLSITPAWLNNVSAMFYLATGNTARAIQSAEAAVAIQPNNPLFLDNLARAYFEGGSYAKALVNVSRAAAIDETYSTQYAEYREVLTAFELEQEANRTKQLPRSSVVPKSNAIEGTQKYLWIPPGDFLMGCVPDDGNCEADEVPRHVVVLTKGVWMARTTVTLQQYLVFATATGAAVDLPYPDILPRSMAGFPMTNMTWEEAQAYCTWAGGRLPTEAEWEYAARAGGERWISSWGNGPPPMAASYLRPVGELPPNGFGLFDMGENIWEWTSDWYDASYYEISPPVDPQGPPSGTEHSVRGGAWDEPYGESFRISNRGRVGSRPHDVGVRCVQDERKR